MGIAALVVLVAAVASIPSVQAADTMCLPDFDDDYVLPKASLPTWFDPDTGQNVFVPLK